MEQIDPNELVKQGELVAAGLINVWAFVQALAFFYIPPLRKWHNNLAPGWKPGVMAVGQALAAIVVGLISFTLYPVVEPSVRGILVLVVAWIFSLATNQGTYSTLVRPYKQNG